MSVIFPTSYSQKLWIALCYTFLIMIQRAFWGLLAAGLVSACTHAAAVQPPPSPPPAATLARPDKYLGSAFCEDCHTKTSEKWKLTRMSRSVRVPAEAELKLVASSILCGGMKVDLVEGGRTAIRYLQKRGGHYVYLPCEWDVLAKTVKPVKTARATKATKA